MSFNLERDNIDAIYNELGDRFEDYSFSGITERLGMFYDLEEYVIRMQEIYDLGLDYKQSGVWTSLMHDYIFNNINQEQFENEIKNQFQDVNYQPFLEENLELIKHNQSKLQKSIKERFGFVVNMFDLYVLDHKSKNAEYNTGIQVLKERIKDYFSKQDQKIIFGVLDKYRFKNTKER